MIVKQLTSENWKIWKSLRLESLKDSPESFASSYEEEVLWSDADFQKILNSNTIFGAFDNDLLIGCAAFYSLNSLKTKHRGAVWGMYIKEDYRGNGVANSLLKEVITYARSKVIQLHLTCVTSNLIALSLYQKHGLNNTTLILKPLKLEQHILMNI